MKNRTTMDMKKRMLIVLIACLFGFVYDLGHLVYWQFVRGSEMTQAAVEQQTRDKTINSKRGSILDRNGNVLAASVSVETLTASPVEVQKNDMGINEIAVGLSEIIDVDYESI